VHTSPGLAARSVDRFFSRLRKLPPARNKYVVERGLRTPTRDGFVLVSDHYSPAVPGPDAGTILIRSPYGRGLPTDVLWARTFAARGYHVILQSCRGTMDSTDTFQPMAREADDGQDTVVWLREQPWFNGALGMIGMSYQAYALWAILSDPPPELRASVMIAGPHDFSKAMWESNAFALETFLGWAAANSIPFDERPNLVRQLLDTGRNATQQRAAIAGLPMADAAESILNGRAPWYREWLEHPDLNDPYWNPYNVTEGTQRVTTPTLLVGGWQDVFIGQTTEQYETLRTRGVDVALTLGPWTHPDHVLKGSVVIDNEALDWFDMHLGSGRPDLRAHPVRTFVTGRNAWRASSTWPPSHTDSTWHLNDDGVLGTTAPANDGTSIFASDPEVPTPALGGRRLSTKAGVQDNAKLEARPDVLTFTTAELVTDLEFEGFPVVDVSLSVDNPYADVFIRICDVDQKGRSHNIADTLVRLDPTVPSGEVQHITARLSPAAHRLMKGHRLRLQLSGGAHPQYARNLGTGGPLSTATDLKPAVHTINHRGTQLRLPVSTTAD